MEDILRQEANEAAQQALEDACRFAFAKGRIHLVSVHFASGPGPQREALNVENAVAQVRNRHLENDGDNAELIIEGLKWCNTLHMETDIVVAMEKAFPLLKLDFKSLTKAPVAGAPWAGTTVGHAVDCDKRREVWSQVEELSAAIKVAHEGGASHSLVEVANTLMSELIARTPELPADRCVLDPAGRGVKLLPRGRQRALWHHTGDSYLYKPDEEKQGAGELNDFDLPPHEQLRDTSVDACRPVCSTYATTKTCKLGKRCPWRHVKPVKGDSIREPIGF